jgi:fructose-1,6-bisphosphatase/inositol monophosphatase family enzyme
MVEAAKGRFVYVNLWPGRDTEPYDLAGSVLLVRAAGGEVIGVSGQPIDPLTLSGPFVAAVDPEVADTVRRIVFPNL